jgi:hypothetical protein
MPFIFSPSMFYLLTVQPFGHIPTDMIVRLQFHIIVPLHEINLSRKSMLNLINSAVFLFVRFSLTYWKHKFTTTNTKRKQLTTPAAACCYMVLSNVKKL